MCVRSDPRVLQCHVVEMGICGFNYFSSRVSKTETDGSPEHPFLFFETRNCVFGSVRSGLETQNGV